MTCTCTCILTHLGNLLQKLLDWTDLIDQLSIVGMERWKRETKVRHTKAQYVYILLLIQDLHVHAWEAILLLECHTVHQVTQVIFIPTFCDLNCLDVRNVCTPASWHYESRKHALHLYIWKVRVVTPSTTIAILRMYVYLLKLTYPKSAKGMYMYTCMYRYMHMRATYIFMVDHLH